MPSAVLFTDLDKLKEEDIFYIHSLDKVLAYKVDQIKVVLPEETDDLTVAENQDYVTLITCTPYGVNTHRLLVRGHRVPYDEKEKEKIKEVVGVDKRMIGAGAIIVGAFLIALYRRKKRKTIENIKWFSFQCICMKGEPFYLLFAFHYRKVIVFIISKVKSSASR